MDSSKDRLETDIVQEGKPAAYASKSLTDSQKNYAQIEKNARNSFFNICRVFEVETDHKPLDTIFKKPLDKIILLLLGVKQVYN